MKKQFYIYGLFAAALTLGACDYNEDNFPGFDELAQPKHVWNDTLTLGSNDYKTIAEMAANKELALSKDPEGKSFADALSAVASNKFFTEDAPALWYLPAFIANKYPYMDDKSKVTVHYDEFANLPAYVTRLAGVKNYTFDSNDYKVVWGEEQRVSFVSPSTKSKISDALAAGISNPKDGDIVAVNYAWSDTEPSFGEGGSQEPEVTYTPIGQITDAGDYTAKGTVVGVNAKSFIIQDETGMMRVYRGNLPSVAVGDVVEMNGQVQTTNQQLLRFSSKADVKFLERAKDFAYPESKKADAAYFDQYVDKVTMEYITFDAKVVKSGDFTNFIIDGTNIQPSPTDPLFIDESLFNQQVEVTGYVAGLSGTTHPNIFVTSIVKKGEKNSIIPVGTIQYVAPDKEYSVCGVVTAVNLKSFMLADGTGNVLVYLAKKPEFVVGDVVTVTGKANKFDGAIRLKEISAMVKKGTNAGVVKSMVAPDVMPDEVEAWAAVPRVAYFSVTGKMSIVDDKDKTGHYFNVLLGTANYLSLSSVDEKSFDMSLNGKNVTVTGYIQGQPYNGRINVIYTSVKEATAAAAFAMTRAAVTPNASALYAYDGEAKVWKKYVEEGVDVNILQPSDYAMFGSNYVGKPADMLPLYLTKNYPFAKIDDVAAVVYVNDKDDKDKLGASEFKFDGSAWVMTTKAAPSVITFQKSEGAWVEARVYLDASFKDNDGNFKADNITLPENSTYVWKYNSSYSNWRASAFVEKQNRKSESYLVSPEFELTKAINPVVVFDCAIQYLNDGDLSKLFNLVVSDNYVEGKITEDTWKVLKVNQWPAGNSSTFVTVESESLAAYAGKKIRIAFHYKSTTESAPTVDIKNLVVKE